MSEQHTLALEAAEAALACERVRDAAPDLLRACQTFAEWLRREEAGMPAQINRDTPAGEREWRTWYDGNLQLCREAQDCALAAIAKATGSAA